ncbi:hypothetical protein PoB_007401600 [Plakobranchus ocellatus]|uniref:Uncharacterized protein n=1 Tax=Plakobranchus ocellatus TaxID=259542 RepID=A0AAV4DTV2_9GAST|nr:hypothetical protein PoB_007401600 [Plakobranchus ocellatus]
MQGFQAHPSRCEQEQYARIFSSGAHQSCNAMKQLNPFGQQFLLARTNKPSSKGDNNILVSKASAVFAAWMLSYPHNTRLKPRLPVTS